MKKIALILTLLLSTLLNSKLINYNIKPKNLLSNSYMGITILDSKELKFKKYKGYDVEELSALAFKKNQLYALDDKGKLYTFKIKIKSDKIKKLKLKNIVKLKDKKGNKLSRFDRDSEGMVLVNGAFLVSFEKNPRVEIFSLNAKQTGEVKINKKLRDIDDYRSANTALEALAYNYKYGLVTAPEAPLKKKNLSYHTLYAKKKTWKFRSYGNITALEFINDDEILIMMRSFNHFSRSREIVLSKINLSSCEKKDICKSTILARLNSKDGWKIDNFEGLTKVDKNRYLMISDDNGSFLQKTLLVLFKIN